MKETKEFIELQKVLLKHKKSYYVLDNPEISHYAYNNALINYENQGILPYRTTKQSNN
jgi:NAD-dependent DNA ligase